MPLLRRMLLPMRLNTRRQRCKEGRRQGHKPDSEPRLLRRATPVDMGITSDGDDAGDYEDGDGDRSRDDDAHHHQHDDSQYFGKLLYEVMCVDLVSSEMAFFYRLTTLG